MPFQFETDNVQVTPGGVDEGINAGRGGLDPAASELLKLAPPPDEAAKQQNLSRDLAIPQDIIQQDPQRFEQDKRIQDTHDALVNHPVTSEFVNDPVNTPVVGTDVHELTLAEELSRSLSAGRKTVELGKLGTEWRSRPKDYILQQQIDKIDTELSKLQAGLPTEGATSWLTSTAQVLGQMYETTDKGLFAAVGAGAAAGGAVGMTGFTAGPLGFATVPGGAVTGATLGATGYYAYQAYVQEGGSSYIDMRKEGIPHEYAAPLSQGVGIMNAALEIGGMGALLKPVSAAVKAKFRKAISEAIVEYGTKEIAKRVGKNYAIAVGGEIATEVAQEAVSITAEEMGKKFSGLDLEAATPEEIKNRLLDIAEMTLKSSVLIALPGAGAEVIAERGAAKRAIKNAEALKNIKETVDSSKLAGRDPETLSNYYGHLLQSSEMKKVYVDGERFSEWAAQAEGGDNVVRQLGIEDQLRNAAQTGQDVEIDANAFGKYVMTNPNFDKVVGDIKAGRWEMSANQAEELNQTSLADQVGQLPDPSGNPEVDMAEHQLGLRAFFMSAEEAGMTPAKYEDYLKEQAQARDEAVKQQELKQLRADLNELTPEYQTHLAEARTAQTEHLRSEPVYQSVESIGATRLDRAQVEQIVKDMGLQMEDLPKTRDGRAIYSTKDEKVTVDPQLHAELHGYDNAYAMIWDWQTNKPFDVAIEEAAQREVANQYGELVTERQRIEAAINSLHNDVQEKLLMTELNALREAQKTKALSVKLVNAAVKKHISETKVKDIHSARFQVAEHKAAKEASRALKKGDYLEAQKQKFRHVMNHKAARQVSKLSKELAKQKDFMAQWISGKHENMPVEHLQAIREILSAYNFGRRITEERLLKAKGLANQAKTAAPIKMLAALEEQAKLPHWQDMTYGEFQDLYDKIKEIAHKGLEQNKLQLEADKEALDRVADIASAQIMDLKPTSAAFKKADSLLGRLKEAGRGIQTMIFTMDTVTRLVDGFQDLGHFYQNTKGRLDRALSRGYLPGQIGYLRRWQQASQSLLDLNSVWSKQEKLDMKKPIRIPGVQQEMTHEKVITALLNMGNEGNLQALVESGTFTEDEIQAIRNHASKKDMDYVQSILDYIETYWDDIAATQKRRRNQIVEKVEATPIETPHGTYRGGYFPIRYDNKQSLTQLLSDNNMDALAAKARFGEFAQSHTARGHVEARKNPGHKPVDLNMYGINAHLERVIYDLEVGDALTDIHKVWFHPKVKGAFETMGYQHMWEAGRLWLMDAISGELIGADVVQQGLRYLRTGWTISKLGLNIGVALQQPLGLLQSSVHIGHGHMLRGLYAFFRSPWYTRDGKTGIFDWIDQQDGIMAARSETFDKDVHDARAQFALNWKDRITPGDTMKLARSSMFYPIRKLQRLTDAITWLAGYDKGMKEFDDHQKAVDVATRAVNRSQASGLWTERSAIERGTINQNHRQSELVRLWTTMISYFIAKANVAYERSHDINWTKPTTIISAAGDFVVLYTIETMLSDILTGRAPPPEDSDAEDYLLWMASSTITPALTPFPIIREGMSAVRGFAPGGVVGSVADDVGHAWKQMSQGEIDAALVKSFADVVGPLAHAPTSQFGKFLSAGIADEKGRDVNPADYILGYHKDK